MSPRRQKIGGFTACESCANNMYFFGFHGEWRVYREAELS